MPVTLTTANQTRWKDCYASSAKVGLTLMSNGEEPVQVYNGSEMVPAGITTPGTAPTVAAGSGTMVAGFAVYRYVYASTQYPNAEAIVDAGGNEWVKGQPSPASAVFTVGAATGTLVTVATLPDPTIDRILIYRAHGDTAADVTALGAAGNLYYVGFLVNNGLSGTAIFVDNGITEQEQLELDNYPAPQFWLCCFEDPYWWGFGNPELIVAVTLGGAFNITAATAAFFSGRDGQLVRFDGISTGGFDGVGTYYFKYVSPTVANVATDPLTLAPVIVSVTGTTTMRVHGPAGTLYRSKPRNPFAWGFTEYQTGADGSVIRVPQEYAFPVGGRGSAICVMTEDRILKLDVENPAAVYALNLNLAGTSDFESTKRTLDRQYSVSSHFSQFVASLPSGVTALRGIDVSNLCLVQAGGGNQGPVGDEVFTTMRSMVTTGDYPRLYHGVYDVNTELSCWWIKTVSDPAGLVGIDTCVCYHGPSGQWSTFRDFDVTVSASIYDPVTLRNFTMTGDRSGHLCEAFADGTWNNILSGVTPNWSDSEITAAVGSLLTFFPLNTCSTVLVGTWLGLVQGVLDGANVRQQNGRTLFGRVSALSGTQPQTLDVVVDLEAGIAYDGTTLPAGLFNVNLYTYPGLIECRARTYLQPSQTTPSQNREVWASYRNVTAYTGSASKPPALGYDFLLEFQSTPFPFARTGALPPPLEDGSLAQIIPTQTTQYDGTAPSINWLVRDVPTPLTVQLGWQITERGFGPFQVLGLDIKNVQTT